MNVVGIYRGIVRVFNSMSHVMHVVFRFQGALG
jgi:hypothetical protein